MVIGEPGRTQGDLNFRVLGIPVRVHPFFWVVAVLMGIGGGPAPEEVLIWVAAMFVSILVHEMGHALAIRKFGWQPWITLYGLGGLASYQPSRETPREKILISLAGPGAGFLLAGVVVVFLYATGHFGGFVFDIVPIRFIHYGGDRDAVVNHLIWSLLVVNILWGLINLFPVYPLDGGQVARELLSLRNPYEGIQKSLWLSIYTAGGLAVFAIFLRQFYVMLMFGYLAYMSYKTLQNYTGSGRW